MDLSYTIATVISKFLSTDVILSLDKTDEEAKNQFLEEIELMKVIGSHRNIVSMLGCCVKSDPIFLLLEYVPYGDLQHWLRNKRIQVGREDVDHLRTKAFTSAYRHLSHALTNISNQNAGKPLHMFGSIYIQSNLL